MNSIVYDALTDALSNRLRELEMEIKEFKERIESCRKIGLDVTWYEQNIIVNQERIEAINQAFEFVFAQNDVI